MKLLKLITIGLIAYGSCNIRTLIAQDDSEIAQRSVYNTNASLFGRNTYRYSQHASPVIDTPPVIDFDHIVDVTAKTKEQMVDATQMMAKSTKELAGAIHGFRKKTHKASTKFRAGCADIRAGCADIKRSTELLSFAGIKCALIGSIAAITGIGMYCNAKLAQPHNNTFALYSNLGFGVGGLFTTLYIALRYK